MIDHIVLYGEPRGKERPRVANGHAYTPQKTREYEEAMRLAYVASVKSAPHERGVPLKLTLYCEYPIPKSDSKKKHGEKANGTIKPTIKPDLSNVLKAVEDALNGVAYFDDSQITKIVAIKRYGDSPRVETRIEVDNEQDNQNGC